MSDQEQPEQVKAPASGVPDALLGQLHEANDKFHEAKKHMDAAMNASIDGLTERERASSEMKDAEHAVEEVEQQVRKELKKSV